MTYNFDEIINRRESDSAKWRWYSPDALPMWVADMDFVSPEPVLRALRERVDHGVFGYPLPPAELAEVICQRMADRYGWIVTPAEIVYLPGLVSGVNAVCRAAGQPGDSVLVQTPVYPPFLSAPANHGQTLITAPLTEVTNGRTISYQIDFEAFEAAITPATRLFILCNPHNPIGRGYTRAELTEMAAICLRHNVLFCSDEIHSDLLLGDTHHIPTAALSPEIAQHTITLLAPSKTYNVPGLGCSIAIIQNKALRQRVEKAAMGIVPHVNVLGYVAALAAYRDGDDWLTQLLAYLTANRDYMVGFISRELPGIRTTVPEATYLAWLDCREAGLDNPHKFFLNHAKVAMNNGADFGPGGEGFVRLNFGCPRSILEQGLHQLKEALNSR
jgi:cystathionine beta-lyase